MRKAFQDLLDMLECPEKTVSLEFLDSQDIPAKPFLAVLISADVSAALPDHPVLKDRMEHQDQPGHLETLDKTDRAAVEVRCLNLS